MCSRTAFGIRRYSLKRATVKGAPQGEKGSTNDGDLDAEKGENVAMNNDTLSHGSHHDIDIEPIDVEEEGTVREEASRRSSKEIV